MIDFINGVIARKGDGEVVVDVGGIGFRIAISAGSAEAIGQAGEEVRLLTWLLHKEDSMELFGFASEGERKLFGALLSVNGVGPRMALNILSGMPPEDLVSAIVRKDYGALTSIKGLGRKRAEKICFSLDGSLDDIDIDAGAGGAVRDAVDALVALGFPGSDSSRAVREASNAAGESSADALIRMALDILRK